MIHHGGTSSVPTHPFLFFGGIWTGCRSSRCIFLTAACAFCSICLGTFRKRGISLDGSRCLWGLKSCCNRNRMIVLLSRLIGGAMSGTSKCGAPFYGKSILIVGAVLEHKHCEKQLWLKPPTWGRWIIHQARCIPSSCADVNAEGLRGNICTHLRRSVMQYVRRRFVCMESARCTSAVGGGTFRACVNSPRTRAYKRVNILLDVSPCAREQFLHPLCFQVMWSDCVGRVRQPEGELIKKKKKCRCGGRERIKGTD